MEILSKIRLPRFSLLLLLVVIFGVIDRSLGQRRVCYFDNYRRQYICYYPRPTTPRPRTVQTCQQYQRRYYVAQTSYASCCGPQSVVTRGSCCKAKFYYAYNRCYTYCMCSSDAVCRQTVNPLPFITPLPTTTPTTPPTTPTTPPTTPTTPPTTPTTPTTTPTTPTTTPTTPPTTPTTTPTTPTTTPTTPTTPTTTPTTPTTTPTTPTTTPTTPTTTTTAATTTPLPKLCPTYRLLNSQSANECDFPGITSIERTVPNGSGGTISSCNAVLVPAQIGDVTRTAFFTSKLCKDMVLNLAIKGNAEFNFKIGGRSYPIDVGSMFDIVDDPTKGSSYFVVKERFATLFEFQGTCQQPACVMTRSMIGKIDYSDCEVVSYGSNNAEDLSQAGLRKVKVHITINDACSDQAENFGEVNTMCFTTSSGQNLLCSNDMGAAVFCRANSNEKVLIGGAAFQKACDSSPHFRLIPYPITKLIPVPVV